MATSMTADRVIFLHKIDGRDERNAPDVTTILIIDDSEGSTLRYRVGRTRTGHNAGQPFDVEAFRTAEAAEQYAAELAAASREQYRLELAAGRDARKWAMLDLAAKWDRNDPAREAVEALAAAIGDGTERIVISALKAYDPIPERRIIPLL